MKLLRSIFLLCGLTFLASCGPPQITDFSDRSVVYVWVDVTEARGNKVVGGSFRNFAPGDGGGVYPAGVEKFGDGFLIYHEGIAAGPTKLNTVEAMFCIGLCGNTINVYDFGNQGGNVAATTVRSRGVYDLGRYAIISQRTGLFSPRVFDVQRTSGPSKRQVLQFLLTVVGDDQKPVVQAALNNL